MFIFMSSVSALFFVFSQPTVKLTANEKRTTDPGVSRRCQFLLFYCRDLSFALLVSLKKRFIKFIPCQREQPSTMGPTRNFAIFPQFAYKVQQFICSFQAAPSGLQT